MTTKIIEFYQDVFTEITDEQMYQLIETISSSGKFTYLDIVQKLSYNHGWKVDDNLLLDLDNTITQYKDQYD